MRIEDWSRTRWVVCSLLLGLGLSFVRTQIGEPAPTDRMTYPIHDLEPKLLREPIVDADKRAYPWVKDIYVYPSRERALRGGATAGLTLVTFSVLEIKGNEFFYQRGAAKVEEPLESIGPAFRAPDLTTRAYFDEVSERAGHRIYQYVWWLEPRWIYVLWTGSAFLLIGFAWPIVLDRLIDAGYGRRSEVLPPSLWARWRVAREARARRAAAAAADPMLQKAPAADPRSLSAEEQARLDAMEAGLRDFTAAPASPDDSGAPVAEEPVRELHAGPLQNKTEEARKDEKSYGGTFYPTVAHARRKPEDGAKDESK